MRKETIKNLLQIAAVVAIAFIFIRLFGYIQNDHLELPCVAQEGNTYYFDRNGEVYPYESKKELHVGSVYKVDMFDLENNNIYDDVIVGVGREVVK